MFQSFDTKMIVNTKFLFFTGKGGVGKTSTACATAVTLADEGKKVIQSNMSPIAIVDVWENTEPVFVKFNVPLTETTLETTIDTDILHKLLIELNAVVVSSTDTCIEGG